MILCNSRTFFRTWMQGNSKLFYDVFEKFFQKTRAMSKIKQLIDSLFLWDRIEDCDCGDHGSKFSGRLIFSWGKVPQPSSLGFSQTAKPQYRLLPCIGTQFVPKSHEKYRGQLFGILHSTLLGSNPVYIGYVVLVSR